MYGRRAAISSMDFMVRQNERFHFDLPAVCHAKLSEKKRFELQLKSGENDMVDDSNGSNPPRRD